MPSFQARMTLPVIRLLRNMLKEDLSRLQQRMIKMEHRFPIPQGVRITPETAAPVPAEWTEPIAGFAPPILLYFHGGGFVLGSPRSHRALVAEIARAAGIRALSVDYRLAPEYPFPAALEDTTAMVLWLLDRGTPSSQIVLGGDSAGGNLVLVTLLKLREIGAPLPAAAFCLSPVTDMTGNVPSRKTLMDKDPLLPPEAARWIEAYTGASALDLPYLSPLYADLHGLPPILIQVGTLEMLLDDGRQFAEKARQSGVDICLEIYPGMWHVFQIAGHFLPEARQAISSLVSFIKEQVPASTPTPAGSA